MESTPLASVGRTVRPLAVQSRSLVAAFARVPDPRRVASVAYRLAAVLSLAVAAILANQLSDLAITRRATRQPTERLRALGFPDGRTPCQSTFQCLFCTLDGQALSAGYPTPVRGYPNVAPVAVALPVAAGSRGVAINGKAQRGRLPFQVGGSPVHATPARGYPAIENSLHRVKDVTLGEDQSTLHSGQGPTVMAFLRDAAVSLLRRAGNHQMAARLREHAQDPAPAITLILAAPTHA